MKRTRIQKAIIPRNWLFGRLTYLKNNLRAILTQNNSKSFSAPEKVQLSKCLEILERIVDNKEKESNWIKQYIKDYENSKTEDKNSID